MRCASWVVATLVVTGLVACSLTTSLDGLSNGEESATPTRSEGGSPDAPSNDGAADARTSADADADADANADADADGGARSYRALVLGDAPFAYYRLGDTGTVAKDETGAHDGTYIGPLKHVAGAIVGDTDTAASFDGTTSYIAVGGAPDFEENAPFTLEAWVAPAGATGFPMCPISKTYAPMGASGVVAEGYSVYLGNPNHDLRAIRVRNSATEGLAAPNIPEGAFAHVVVTFDGAQFLAYVNGKQVGTAPSTQALVKTTVPLTIGAARGGLYCYFHGALDEVALYTTSLSAARVAAHYKAATNL